RPISRQLQALRDSFQLLFPVGQTSAQSLTLQPLALPQGEVRILHRQRLERILSPLTIGLIQDRKLPVEDPLRPPVRDDVAHRPQQNVILLAQFEQPYPQRRTMPQVEGLPSFPSQRGQYAFPLRLLIQSAQVFQRQIDS